MAKKKSRRRNGGVTLPVAVIGGMMPATAYVADGFANFGLKSGLHRISIVTTGYSPEDNKWRSAHLIQFMGPVLLGAGIHKLAGKLGINRAIARSGIPYIRI